MNASHALRARECATACPRGNQQTIDLFAVFAIRATRRQHARVEIKPSAPSRKPEIKIEFIKLFRLRQSDSVRLPSPREKLLGERWTIVGMVRLIADERDRATEAFTTECFRGTKAGK